MEKQTVEYRAYFFQNFYLQGIHAGIQSQHTTAEMFLKYSRGCDKGDFLYEWAENHKTTVILSGGMQQDLETIYHHLSLKENPYPFSKFHEAAFSLNGALTNVGIILPDRIFKAPYLSEHFDGDEIFEQYRFENKLTEWEVEFIRILKSKRLMN